MKKTLMAIGDSAVVGAQIGGLIGLVGVLISKVSDKKIVVSIVKR